MSMECPNCGRTLAENATFCASCGWKVAGPALDRTVTNLAKVGRDAFQMSVRLADETAKAIQPAFDKAAKAITTAAKPVTRRVEPAAEKVARAASKAVEKGARKTRAAAHKGAEAAERAARKVKEKTR